MEYNRLVSDMDVGDEVEGFYVLKNALIKTSSAGKPFLTGFISDKSGDMELKVWDYPGPIGGGDDGKVVKIRGVVSEYRGSLQITISRIRLATEGDNYDPTRLVPTAPIHREGEMDYIRTLVATIADPDYLAVAEEELRRHQAALALIPAAKSVHHGFLSGLLMHTANMLRCADFLAGLYGDVIDRSLLLTGTLLHDLAKEREFAFSELGIVTDYSVKGQLLGHLVMGAQEAAEVCREMGVPEEKSVLLQHMILSHHGEPEFGAAVRPQCAEAELLHHIDSIDSRMEIYREVFQEVPAGEFSQRIFALDRKIYHHE